MKPSDPILIGSLMVVVLGGCVSKPVALAPVGPAAGAPTSSSGSGSLEVFSSTEKSMPTDSEDHWVFDLPTGYEIYDSLGKEYKYVANHLDNMDESPDMVQLPAGHYTVEARSKCCGVVTVPVIIEKGKTTVVHLDDNWGPPKGTPQDKIVFQPDGSAVGWRSS
jgi:hypothetical protein